MQTDSLPTPIPLVDLDRLDANITRVADYAAAHALTLRPHVKTHKSLRIGRAQLDAGATGFTCATPREAEVMRTLTDDILLAYPPVGHARAARVAELARHTRLRVMLDSREAVNALIAAAAGGGGPIGVLVELDLGMGRVGVGTPAEAVTLARHVAEQPGLEYLGVAFYPRHIRGPGVDDALAVLNRDLGSTIDALTRAGMPPIVVSGGSTPTLWDSHRITGLTEIRPGTSVYNDRTTAEIGACGWDDCALTVLATVVSTAVPGQAIVDAGTKALGREPIRGADVPGFGVLLDRPEVYVRAMSEEHGTLELSQSSWRPTIGEQVRIIPNHVCIVTHLFDEAVGVRRHDVIERWPIDARGR